MTPRTHEALDPTLCGHPTALEEGRAQVEMDCPAVMAADGRGLVHGGFLFGVADHAAMLAVNEPTVVLGAADVRFLQPVTVGDRVRAEATVTASEGRKRIVQVQLLRGEEAVMKGVFTCLVPDRHVLEAR